MLHTAIILNGPPGVGKDTIAKLFADNLGYTQIEFKYQLYEDTALYFGVSPEELKRRNQDRKLKEKIWNQLKLKLCFLPYPLLLSPREALMYVSEDVIKPREGSNYFGRAAVQHCVESGKSCFIFSDSGFLPEVLAIQQAFKNTLLVHLYREGCEWGNDTRSYVKGVPNTLELTLVEDRPDLAVGVILNHSATLLE